MKIDPSPTGDGSIWVPIWWCRGDLVVVVAAEALALDGVVAVELVTVGGAAVAGPR